MALTEGREALRFRPWSIKFILSQQTNPCSARSSFFWLEEGGSISVPSATIEQFAVARKT